MALPGYEVYEENQLWQMGWHMALLLNDTNGKWHLSLFISIFCQVEFQREAYEQLVLEKDVKHERLRTEITLIEQELKRLTALELDRKLVKAEQDKVILAEHRWMDKQMTKRRIAASWGPKTGQEISQGWIGQSHSSRTQVYGQTND